VWLTFETGRFNHGPYGFAGGLRAEHTEILLPALGVAVVVQAVSTLLFVASVIWTGKFHKVPFFCWQFIYVFAYGFYTTYYWPSTAGLLLGAGWATNLACNVWITLRYHIKVREMKNARATTAHTSTGLMLTAKRENYGDDPEEADRALNGSLSSMAEKVAPERDWYFAYVMLFQFSAGTLGFYSAYLTGTLNTALTTFGLGFLGMLIGALVLLGTTSTSHPHRLADHFKTANVGSAAFFLTFAVGTWQESGVFNFGWLCVMLWAACLNSGIAEVLVQKPLEQDLDDEEHDSEDSDEDWVHVD